MFSVQRRKRVRIQWADQSSDGGDDSSSDGNTFVSARRRNRWWQPDSPVSPVTVPRAGVFRRIRVHKTWREIDGALNSREFIQRYRVDRLTFDWLLNGCGPCTSASDNGRPHRHFCGLRTALATRPHHYRFAATGAGQQLPIQAEVRLCAALRYFAGGQVYDISDAYGISRSEVYRCISATIDAINERVPWPDASALFKDKAWCEQSAAKFARRTPKNASRWVVAALDGVLFKMLKPRCTDVDDPNGWYVARKATYGLLMQAMCDAVRTFTHTVCRHCS